MKVKLYYGPTHIGIYDTITKNVDIEDGIGNDMEAEFKYLLPYIRPIFEYGIPEGRRLQLYKNEYISELIKGHIPWLSVSSSIDTGSNRDASYIPVPISLQSGSIINTNIDRRLFLPENSSQRHLMPVYSGHKDKFQGNIVEADDGYILQQVQSKDDPGNVIIKPQVAQYPCLCENEFIFMQLAERAGIEVPRTFLCRDSAGELHYCIERFGIYRDIDGNILKENIIDFLGLMHARVRDKYNISLDDLFLCASKFLSCYDLNRFARMWFYGYLIGNTDMHPKNFSLFIRPNNKFKLAPAYDMVHMPCYGFKHHSCLKEEGKALYSTAAEIEKFILKYLSWQEVEEVRTTIFANAVPLINLVFRNVIKDHVRLNIRNKLIEFFTVYR